MANSSLLTPEKLDAEADLIASRYRDFLIAMTGGLAKLFDKPWARTERGRNELWAIADGEISARYQDMKDVINATTVDALSAGLDMPGNLTEEQVLEVHMLVGEDVSVMDMDLMSWMMRDAYVIRKTWADFAMDSRLLYPRRGAMGVLAARRGKIAMLKFKQKDSAGRQYESAYYARTQLRHHLLRTQVEARLYKIAALGGDLATITWGDGRQDMTVTISGDTPGYPSYFEIRDDVFHPNSTARLK